MAKAKKFKKDHSRKKDISKGKATVTNEMIRQRAYRIWLSRSGGPGDAMSDWLKAEHEVSNEMKLMPQHK